MLEIDISKITAAVVEQELRQPVPTLFPQVSHRETHAIHFHFDLRMYYHMTRKDGSLREYNTSRGLHLLYWCPYGGYVSVFSAVMPSPFGGIKKVEQWKHESSHDSCWRDIVVFSQTYFAMAREINAARRKETGAKPVASIKMQQHHSLPIFGNTGLYSWVPVKVSKDPTDTNNYRKVVELL